jgi:hypothetical protein
MFRQRLSAAVSASEAGTGLRFLASYTLAKAIDNASGGDEFHFSTIPGNQLEKLLEEAMFWFCKVNNHLTPLRPANLRPQETPASRRPRSRCA